MTGTLRSHPFSIRKAFATFFFEDNEGEEDEDSTSQYWELAAQEADSYFEKQEQLLEEAEKLKAKLGLGEDGEASEVYTTALELIKESIGEEEYTRRLSAFMEEPPLE